MEIRINNPIASSSKANFGFSFTQEESLNKKENNAFLGKFLRKITPKDSSQQFNADLENSFDVLNFVKSHYDKSVLENIVVQLNVPTKFSKLLSRTGVYLESKIENLGKKIQCAYENNIAIAFFNGNRGLIMLGLGILDENKITATLSKTLSRKEILSFTILHELSHCLEAKNDMVVNYDNIHLGFKNVADTLKKYAMDGISNLNDMLIKNGADLSFNKEDLKNMKDLHAVYIESYADLSAIMLYKNYMLSQNTYSEEKFNNFIMGVSDTRKEIFLAQDKINKDIGYATFLAIEKLFDKNLMQEINILENMVIPNDLIHQIASLAAIQSCSELISIKIEHDEKFKNLIEKLSMFQITEDAGYPVGNVDFDKMKKIDEITSEKFSQNKEGYKKLIF